MVSFFLLRQAFRLETVTHTSAPVHQHKVVTGSLYQVQVLILHCSCLLWPQAQQLLHGSALFIIVQSSYFFYVIIRYVSRLRAELSIG